MKLYWLTLGLFVNLLSGVPLGSLKLVSGLEFLGYMQLTMTQLRSI